MWRAAFAVYDRPIAAFLARQGPAPAYLKHSIGRPKSCKDDRSLHKAANCCDAAPLLSYRVDDPPLSPDLINFADGAALSTRIAVVRATLREQPRLWLITGVAGFIGSHLLQELLTLEQTVRGLDNFSAGSGDKIEEVRRCVSPEAWARFTLVQGDIRDVSVCSAAVSEVDCVLHQAALPSVVGSLDDPRTTNEVNVAGFLNVLIAAKEHGVTSFVYASSSAVYGDLPELPRSEVQSGQPLSPYAVTKRVNELYGEVFARQFGFSAVGLRYFNTFGPRQDFRGAYAAVIPNWICSMIKGEAIYINGDGETTRDFCHVSSIGTSQPSQRAAGARSEGRGIQRRNRRRNIAERDFSRFADITRGAGNFL